MANSIHRDINGTDWPLGNIIVAAAGTPINIMSLVDATLSAAPEQPVQSGLAPIFEPEFQVRFFTILFQALKAGAGPPSLANNTGIVYIIRKAAAGGTGNATDKGVIIKALVPGENFSLPSLANSFNIYNPYRYFIDADTNADACQVTGFVAG